MKRRLAAVLVVLLLFWIANRGAYKGFFQDDDLDNLAWTPGVRAQTFLTTLVTPQFLRNNFRPVGHFYFHLMERLSGARYAHWVAVLQALHVLNALLLLVLLRRLTGSEWAASLASLFFLFHPATFDAYWRPMYVFDVCCALFTLLCFHAWLSRRWLLAFFCFWLAYKSKELAVMLPFVLLAYEWVLGEKRWKPLLPMLLTAVSFGAQAWWFNRSRQDTYTLILTPAALATTILFYGGKIFAPFWLAAAGWVRERQYAFALAGAALLFAPLLALPSRLFSVYAYVPLLLISLAAARLFLRIPPWAGAAAACGWLALTFLSMREYRKEALSIASDNRHYFDTVSQIIRESPSTTAFIYDGLPEHTHAWGVDGIVRYLKRPAAARVASVDSPDARALLAETDLVVLSWDSLLRRLLLTRRDPAAPDVSYIRVDRQMPIWQFGEGWFPRENRYRWTRERAVVRLARPPNATRFEMVINVSPQHIAAVGAFRVEAIWNGKRIGSALVDKSGVLPFRFDLPVPAPAAPGSGQLEFVIHPVYRPPNDPRALGAAVVAFGFLP